MSTINHTILAVDDDPAILVAISKRLTAAGYSVSTATEPQRALGVARELVPHALLIDVALPGMDGVTLAGELRRLPGLAAVPIVFITGSADDRFADRINPLGAAHFVAKPFDGGLLVRTLRSLFATDELAEMQRISALKRRQPAW